MLFRSAEAREQGDKKCGRVKAPSTFEVEPVIQRFVLVDTQKASTFYVWLNRFFLNHFIVTVIMSMVVRCPMGTRQRHRYVNSTFVAFLLPCVVYHIQVLHHLGHKCLTVFPNVRSNHRICIDRVGNLSGQHANEQSLSIVTGSLESYVRRSVEAEDR